MYIVIAGGGSLGTELVKKFVELKRDIVVIETDKESCDDLFAAYGVEVICGSATDISVLKAAGIEHKGYTLHCLRHTFATELLNADMGLECLQQLMGHKCIEMTRRYARLTDRTREDQYFKAMSIIERQNHEEHHELDSELQAVLEKEKLLSSHSQELPEHP